MKEIRKEKPLDVYFKNLGKSTSRKSRSKFNKHPTMHLIGTSSSGLGSVLIKGTIARTDPVNGLPHLDELTHHLIAVASASLIFNSPDVTLAALIHDYFKPVFDLRFNYGKNKWDWYHVIYADTPYTEILQEVCDIVSIPNTINILRYHHEWDRDSKICRTGNPICKIEHSELISALETSVPFILPTRRNYTVVHHIRIPGKYRMFILALLKEKLTDMLSKKYSERFKEILGVSRIRFEYRPLRGANTIEEAGNIIKEDGWKIKINDDTMVIPIPSKFHEEIFYFEYSEDPTVSIYIDKKEKVVRGVRLPFGMALFTVYFASSHDAYLLYVNAGFKPLSLRDIIDNVLSELKQKKKNAFTHIDIEKIEASLTGKFQSNEFCVFCGEPGEPIGENEKINSILKAKFTDTWLLLTHGTNVCPVCKLGFEIEELFRTSGLNKYLVQEAILTNHNIIHQAPIFKGKHFIKSISSKIWLELLSEVYYSLHKSKEFEKINKKNEWMLKFYLNPTVHFYPYTAELVPQVIAVALKYQKKKFILQSGLHSNVVFPGSEKDLIPEEFSAIRRFYLSNPRIGVYLLQKIKSVYSPVFGIPKVDIGKGGGSRARKRKN